jgi:hypothetical protein
MRRWVVPSLSLLLVLAAGSARAAEPGSDPERTPQTPPPPEDVGDPADGGDVGSPATPPSPADAPDDAPSSPKATAPPQDLSDTWGYNRGRTQQPRYVRSTEDPILFAPNPAGFYSGVSVSGNQLPPVPIKDTQKVRGTSFVTWTGFERTETGSQVFFQLSNRAAHSVSVKGTTITLRLKNTRVNVRNNARQLDLRYFKTPVQFVRLRRSGKDTIATLVLKRAATPEISVVADAAGTGYQLLVVHFTERVRNAAPDDPPPAP